MTGLGTYLWFLWRRLEGPKPLVVAMSAVAGLAGGLSIAAVNAGVEIWADGRMPWQQLGLFVLAQAAGLLAGYFGNLRAANMVNKLVFEMRTEAVSRVSHSSLRLVESLTPGKLLAMLNYDTQAIGASVTVIVGGLQAAVLVCFSLVYLAQISPVVATLAILAIVIGAAAYLYQEKRMKPLVERSRRANADFHDAVQDVVRGAKEIRLNPAGEVAHLRQIDRLGQRGRILTARTEVLNFTSNSVARLALIGLLGLVAFLPPDLVAVTGVPVFQAITVMLYLVGGIETLVGAAGPITRGRVAYSEYHRVWDLLAPERRGPLLAPEGGEVGGLRLACRGLTYRYEQNGQSFALGPIDLDLQAPELVFITGGNGSGKTTLLKCLTGLYLPDAGTVSLNGEPVTAETIGELRRASATVFHDFHLFDRLYGHSMAQDRPEIEALIDRFGLSGKVTLTGRGFHTTRLSTGQRKRLGLIAALILRRPILVLDEFGAEQDPAFRERLYLEILPQLRDEGRLILAVTHDDRYFDACDRRIHLDYGALTINRTHHRENQTAQVSGTHIQDDAALLGKKARDGK
jgi:putative ATP-binding cassette transporter